MLRLTLTLFISIVLAGCGTVNNRFGPQTLSDSVPNSSTGVVLISTGAKEKCITASTFFKVLKDEHKYFDREIGLLSVDAYPLKSDFSNFHGNVHALALPAGRYYLAPWLANPYTTPKRITRYDFDVKAGEVTYLGNYYMSVQCSLSTTGAFTDYLERDLAVVLSKKPSLNTASVRKQILKPTGLAVERD
jgi:uncharacterized protein YceK